MRILHLSNFSKQRCGISNFGIQLSTALRRAGADVTDWDIEYSHMYALIQRNEPAFLPTDVLTYDVVHFNWHPITTNTFGPERFDWYRGMKPFVSIYLNDVPPWSGCPAAARADILIAAEPSPGCKVLPYPIGDWIEDLPPASTDFTVGWSGVRGDGAAIVAGAVEACNFRANAPDPARGWTTYEDEIRRLATSTVNVSWYHEQRGISGGASQMIAARRPTILNDSAMFRHVQGYPEDLYLALKGETLEALLWQVHLDWTKGELKMPRRVVDELSWTRGAEQLLQWWREIGA